MILSDLLEVTSHPSYTDGQILNMEPLVIRGRVLMLSELISRNSMEKTYYTNATDRKRFNILSFNLPLKTSQLFSFLHLAFFRVYRAL